MSISGITNNTNHISSMENMRHIEHTQPASVKKADAPGEVEKPVTGILGPIKLKSGGTIAYSAQGDTAKISVYGLSNQTGAAATKQAAPEAKVENNPPSNVNTSQAAAAAPKQAAPEVKVENKQASSGAGANQPAKTSTAASDKAASAATANNVPVDSNIAQEKIKAERMLEEGYSIIQVGEKTGLSQQIVNTLKQKESNEKGE